jgi:hypothetical protein
MFGVKTVSVTQTVSVVQTVSVAQTVLLVETSYYFQNITRTTLRIVNQI